MTPDNCERCREALVTQQPGFVAVKSYLYTPAECYDARPVYVDVTRGYEIAKERWAAGRPIYFFEPSDSAIIAGHEIHEEHVDHVPLTEPGLVAMFRFQRKDTGELEDVNHLVDGNHRAARQFKHGRRFYHYALTVGETAAICYSTCEEVFARYVLAESEA